MYKLELYEFETPFTIEYNFYKGEEQTWDYPGSPDEIEIVGIDLFSVPLTDEQVESFITYHKIEDIEELIWEDMRDRYNESQERKQST